MSGFDIVICDTADDADGATFRDAVHEYNFAAAGFRDGGSLSCFLQSLFQKSL